jgi:hypothetical protein
MWTKPDNKPISFPFTRRFGDSYAQSTHSAALSSPYKRGNTDTSRDTNPTTNSYSNGYYSSVTKSHASIVKELIKSITEVSQR